jgi:hypothetical protein
LSALTLGESVFEYVFVRVFVRVFECTVENFI